ncbi:MAG: pyridoxamine 5'-phosphate oxidase family protein [Clostridia bacterium]|nr:pyridoxamine 5'-phosphate oxidase family protein [Clostridia bacterium]
MFRELVRKNKQLPMETCMEVLKTEKRGVLSVQGDNGYPYGMPMNHFYNEDDGCIYFHCGKVGYRLEMLEKCDKVSFCVYDQGYRHEGDWVFNVKSVIVFGRMELIDDMEMIVDVTRRLSLKFIQDEEHIRREIESAAHRTLLMRLRPEHICGKLVREE